MDEIERKVRERYLDRYQALVERSFEAQVAWGRWLVASLLLVNGGAIVTIVQSGARASELMSLSGIFFASGIVLAFICGFCAWINFYLNLNVYSSFADPKVLRSQEEWFTPSTREFHWTRYTMVAAIVAGTLSVVVFIAGIYRINSVLNS